MQMMPNKRQRFEMESTLNTIENVNPKAFYWCQAKQPELTYGMQIHMMERIIY